MPKVEIKNKELRVNGKSLPLISGEVHYWRLNPSFWGEVLDRVSELGINIVSTYVPWEYHEYRRGKFDFTGKTNPTRNLKRFLELTRQKGFKVMIRPGPYIYSEWPNEGAPAYAHEYHRLHPKFLEYAENYLREVTKIIKPFLASRPKGHIVMVQADNEIDPWPDRHGHQYGLNGKPGMFQRFISKLYDDDLQKLNDSWGSAYESFEEVGAFIAVKLKESDGLPLKGDRELKRNLDYIKFKYEYSRQVAEWNVKTFRKLGYDIPIYLNLCPFFYAHDWSMMQGTCDAVGVDFYPANEFSEDALEQRKFMDKSRYLKSISTLPFIAEFESGVWHNRHYETGVLSPNHYRLLAASALLGGIVGWNWYMLVNRDNWYMSPINEWGRTRPELYGVFKAIVDVFHKTQPASWTKLTDIAVTHNPLQYAAKTMPHDSPILVSLYESDIDYELYDPRLGITDKKFLFYSGNQWLDQAAHQNLRRYVEQGGTLIAFRNYPRKNGNFEMSQMVGFEEPRSVLFEFKKQFKVQLAPGRPKVNVVSAVYTFTPPSDAQKISVDIEFYGKTTVGYIKQIGKGRILHFGMEPSRELIMEILNFLKVPLVCYSTVQGVKTGLFKAKGRYYLVAVNNGTEAKNAAIRLPALGGGRQKYKVTHISEDRHEHFRCHGGHPFTLELPRKDGRIIEFRKA